MKPDTEELKRLAQAANSAIEPFTKTADGERWAWQDVCDLHLPELRAFIKVASPSAILALIERLETLEAECKGAVRLTLEQVLQIEAIKDTRTTTAYVHCPICHKSRFNHPSESILHAKDCWLAAAIKEAQGE